MNRPSILLTPLMLLSQILLPVNTVFSHGEQKNLKPSKAAPQIKKAEQALGVARNKLMAQGKYACCVKKNPCAQCILSRGNCPCAANLLSGKGVCGECAGEWMEGNGAFKGIDKNVKVDPELNKAPARQPVKPTASPNGGNDAGGAKTSQAPVRPFSLASLIERDGSNTALVKKTCCNLKRTAQPSAGTTRSVSPSKTTSPRTTSLLRLIHEGEDHSAAEGTESAGAEASGLPEAGEARKFLDEVKRTLVEEGRYSCCIQPGCDLCAREGSCPCGANLLAGKGVCGECFGGWQTGRGALAGVEPHEVHMEPMGEMEGMGHKEGMSREASGTAWQPDSTPMYAHHRQSGPWSVMTHYNAFLNYDRQGGPRGDTDVNSVNWGMLMAQRDVGKGNFMLRGMVSLEPLTIGGFGYPTLLASGETWRGRPLFDRQHPHDLFMELAARYRHPIGDGNHLFLYAGLPGEPALGPVAFPHRISALDNPAATISHHWQDATHISFGVVTAGLQTRKWQAEGSAFKGGEPDENRYNIDRPKLDSYSGRLTYNPSPNWSFSGSYGFLKNPETLHEGDVKKTIFSGMYNRPLAGGGNWATTAIFGRNHASNLGSTDSWLLESNLNLRNRNTIIGRFEHVRKTGEEIVAGNPDAKYGLTALTLGYAHELTPRRSYQTAVGAAVNFYGVPSGLKSVYGSSPTGFWLFLRIRPRAMAMNGAGGG